MVLLGGRRDCSNYSDAPAMVGVFVYEGLITVGSALLRGYSFFEPAVVVFSMSYYKTIVIFIIW